MTLYKDAIALFCEIYTSLWLESEYTMVPLEKLYAQKFYNW